MRVRSFHPIAPDVHSKGAHWSEDALCRGIPEIFFAPVKTRRSDPPDWSRAKRICEGCPVKDKCLTDGLEADKLGAYGIWGGLDPDERGRLGVGSGAPKAAQAAFEAARQAPRAETEETTHA